MTNKGLTLTMVVQASSANYGESIGNVSVLKKMTRGDGHQYTYISRQALRYSLLNMLDAPLAKLGIDSGDNKGVIQYAKDATIANATDIDYFGYMKTAKKENSVTRSAIVRLSNAISQEPYEGDLDFLTNGGLAERFRKQVKDDPNSEIDEKKINNNIAQSEIQTSYYVYTVNVDLDKIGIDTNDNINLSADEKTERVNKLLTGIQYLFRDIRGRREDLSPLFIIGGIYDLKAPFFENAVRTHKNSIDLNAIESVLQDPIIAKDTEAGMVDSIFDNSEEIKNDLKAKSIAEFMNDLKQNVANYYANN